MDILKNNRILKSETIEFPITDIKQYQKPNITIEISEFTLIFPKTIIKSPNSINLITPNELFPDQLIINNLEDFKNNQKIKQLNYLSTLLINETGSIFDLYNKLTPSSKMYAGVPDTIIEYNNDEDLNYMFRNQNANEILRNQGNINFTDDYLIRDESTLKVDTVTSYTLYLYLQKHLGKMLNYYLKQSENYEN